MMSRDPVENEDHSIEPTQSFNLENLPSDMLRLAEGQETDQLFNQLFGAGPNSRSLESNDSSLSLSQGSQGSQGLHNSLGPYGTSQPSPFAQILPSIPQPVEMSNPTMEVVLTNPIIRFRYDSELNNRRTGKEELLKIKFSGVEGNVTILLHTVDTNNKKAHPYWLIGDKCNEGMFVAVVPINKSTNYECTCKATLKIPKRSEYQSSLQARRQKAVAMNINNDDMKKDDYWTANKNMKECRDFRLYVEARYEAHGNTYYMHCITPPLSNAKEGKCFMIHRIMPYVAPASGIQNSKDYIMIVLTADSYIPKTVEVEFVDEEIGWSAKAPKVNIIKNCIECEVPPYSDQNLTESREVFIRLNDRQKGMTAAYNFMYKENEETQLAKKRKLAVQFCAPPDLLQEAGIDTKNFPNNQRPILKATRTKKPGNGGFLPSSKMSPMTSQTSTATTETITHYGVNSHVPELPQLTVKKEPHDTYEGACGYQGNSSAMFSAGEEVTNLLTRGHDPNLQSMSLNGADPNNFNSVSLLLPSGSDGSDREVSMETGINRPPVPSTTATSGLVGTTGLSQVDSLRFQKILQDLKAGPPVQQTSQHGVSGPQYTDENLQSLLQSVIQSSYGQENSQLNFPDDITQMLTQPMYSITSSVGGGNTTQTPASISFPARQTFNPSLQRTTQDIQNMLAAQQQYPGYEGLDATEAGDLETDGGLQAPDTVKLVWENNKDSPAELGDLSDTEIDGEPESDKLDSDTEDEDQAEPVVTRAEAILVKQTHAKPSTEVTSENENIGAEGQDTCDTCIQNLSDSSPNVDKAGGKVADTGDLEADSCSGENEAVNSNQIDPSVCERVGELDKDKSPKLTTLPHSDNTSEPTPQDVSDGLKNLAL